MAKKKSPTIISDGKDLYAVNRAARRQLTAQGILHIPVPMQPLRKFTVGFGSDDAETRYILNGDAFTPPRRELHAR